MLALPETTAICLNARMRIIIRSLVLVVLGLLVGVGSALWMGGLLPGSPRVGNAIEIDGWVSDWSIGSENASPYIRARVARNGLMGLRREEAVYFMKTTDDEGQRLREDCTYTVSGKTFPADWWSITVYGPDNRLPMNEDRALSFDQTQAEPQLETSEVWAFRVQAMQGELPKDRWVSSKAASEFDMTLRLYRPSAALLADPEATLIPPKVETDFMCRGGSNHEMDSLTHPVRYRRYWQPLCHRSRYSRLHNG